MCGSKDNRSNGDLYRPTYTLGFEADSYSTSNDPEDHCNVEGEGRNIGAFHGPLFKSMVHCS